MVRKIFLARSSPPSASVLHGLELLRGGQPLVQRDAGGGRELDDGVLREVLAAHAPVAGPFVDGGRARSRSTGAKASSLNQPSRSPLRSTYPAASLVPMARPMTQPSCRLIAPASAGHVAVVGDDDRHVADLLCRAVIDGLDLLALRARDLQKQRGDHRAVAHERPRGRDADAVDPRAAWRRRCLKALTMPSYW